jgi:transposase-like protein
LATTVNKNLLNWQVATGFESRVREAFEGATIAEIARKTDQNYHTLRNQIKARRGVPIEILIGFAKTTNYTIDWLVTGEGTKRRVSADPSTLLTPEIQEEIRREIVKLLGMLLLSGKDRQFADSMLDNLRDQLGVRK